MQKLFSNRPILSDGWCLGIGALLNVVLLLYVLPRREHLWDIRDYRYVQVTGEWVFMSVAVPTVALLLLLSVLRSSRRWFAVGLCIFPAYLVAAGWVQLIMALI